QIVGAARRSERHENARAILPDEYAPRRDRPAWISHRAADLDRPGFLVGRETDEAARVDLEFDELAARKRLLLIAVQEMRRIVAKLIEMHGARGVEHEPGGIAAAEKCARDGLLERQRDRKPAGMTRGGRDHRLR